MNMQSATVTGASLLARLTGLPKEARRLEGLRIPKKPQDNATAQDKEV